MSEDRIPVCDYEGSDYQERFWEQDDRAYEDGAEAAALRSMLPSGAGKLLELGAGAGRHSSRYKGYERVVLLDYSHSQLKRARSSLEPNGRYLFVVADVYYLPFNGGTFDAATMIRTLHHMVDPEAALASARGVLVGGAAFILEYANKRNLKAVLRWLVRRQTWSPFDPEPIEFAELNYNFHPSAVRRWLREAGFFILDERAVSYLRAEMLKRLLPSGVMIAIDKVLQPTGRVAQMSPSAFVACRAD